MTLNTDKRQAYITKSKRYELILVYLQTDNPGTEVVIQALNRFVSSGATSVASTASTQSLVFCVVFCRPLLVFSPLCFVHSICLCSVFSVILLKQHTACRHVAGVWHIILVSDKPVNRLLLLNVACLAWK